MKIKPYNKVEIEGETFLDYNVRIKGVVYEISVSLDKSTLYVTRDQNQGK